MTKNLHNVSTGIINTQLIYSYLKHILLSRILTKEILLFILYLIKTNSFSQVKISNQPDTSFYRYVVNTISPFALTEKETVSIKAQSLPDGLMDTLRKYDWFDMGGYNYMEGKFRSIYAPFRKLLDEEPHQLDFKRYGKDGIIADFYYQKTKDNIKSIYTTTFDKSTATKITGIKTVKGIAYMINEDFGEITYNQIVSYKNRQLVMDITQYGKIGEKPVKFRVVYFAIDKTFEWNIK